MNTTIDKRYCLQCGNEFVYPDYWEDYRGEYWGAPCYECFEACPICGSLKILSLTPSNRKQNVTIIDK